MLIVYPNNFSCREIKLSQEEVVRAQEGKYSRELPEAPVAHRRSVTEVVTWALSGPMFTWLLLSLTLCLDKLRRPQLAHLVLEDLSCVLSRPCLKPQSFQGTRLRRFRMKTQQWLQSFWGGSGLCAAEAKSASEEKTCFISSCFICRCWKRSRPFRKYTTTNWTRIIFSIIWLPFPALSPTVLFDSTIFKRSRYTKSNGAFPLLQHCSLCGMDGFPGYLSQGRLKCPDPEAFR